MCRKQKIQRKKTNLENKVKEKTRKKRGFQSFKKIIGGEV